MNYAIKPSLWMLMLGLCACQALTGGDEFVVNSSAITQAGMPAVGPKAGSSGDPKAGSSGDPKAGTGGGGHAGDPTPPEPPCERSISGAPCNLAPNCGCDEEKSCALTGATGSTPTLACVTPGPMGPGSVCSVPSDCGAGLLCLGVEHGVCRPYCDDDNDCFGDGICAPVLNDGVPLDGARACFQRCESHDDCATDCCMGNKCADARACELIPLNGKCTKSEMCEGAATGDAACMGGICTAVCSGNADCSSGCCQNAQCADESMCGPTANIGEECTRNGDCIGFESNKTGCVNFTGGDTGLCAARCTQNAQCNSGCCAPTDGTASVCGPPEFCEPDSCRETGTTCATNNDCCEYASGGARCISLSETVAGCAATCTAHSECQSGCCAETTAGHRVCGAAALCGT